MAGQKATLSCCACLECFTCSELRVRSGQSSFLSFFFAFLKCFLVFSCPFVSVFNRDKRKRCDCLRECMSKIAHALEKKRNGKNTRETRGSKHTEKKQIAGETGLRQTADRQTAGQMARHKKAGTEALETERHRDRRREANRQAETKTRTPGAAALPRYASRVQVCSFFFVLYVVSLPL